MPDVLPVMESDKDTFGFVYFQSFFHCIFCIFLGLSSLCFLYIFFLFGMRALVTRIIIKLVLRA